MNKFEKLSIELEKVAGLLAAVGGDMLELKAREKSVVVAWEGIATRDSELEAEAKSLGSGKSALSEGLKQLGIAKEEVKKDHKRNELVELSITDRTNALSDQETKLNEKEIKLKAIETDLIKREKEVSLLKEDMERRGKLIEKEILIDRDRKEVLDQVDRNLKIKAARYKKIVTS